jgi:hypothetical protein
MKTKVIFANIGGPPRWLRVMRLVQICSTIALASLGATAQAQSYSIDWFKVSGGGGTSTGSVYSVSGTIGQPDASGAITGGNYSLTGGFWSFISVVPAAGVPTLYLVRQGNTVVLCWAAPSTGCVLESNNSLATPGGWNTVSPAPMEVNGFNYVTNTLAPGNNFYRLHKP